MDFRVTKAREKDRKEISRLIRKAKIGSLSKGESLNNFWVIKHEGRIIASAGLDFFEKETAIFTYLAVAKEFRHQGAGSALIQHRMKIAKERGARTAAFVTMYYWFNFYKRRGFKTCPRQNLPETLKNYWMFTSSQYKKCAVMLQELN